MFGGMAQALCQASKSSDHTTRFIVYVSVVIGVSLLVYTSGLTNKGNTVLDREQGCSCHFRKAPTRTVSRLLGHLADPPSARRAAPIPQLRPQRDARASCRLRRVVPRWPPRCGAFRSTRKGSRSPERRAGGRDVPGGVDHTRRVENRRGRADDALNAFTVAHAVAAAADDVHFLRQGVRANVNDVSCSNSFDSSICASRSELKGSGLPRSRRHR